MSQKIRPPEDGNSRLAPAPPEQNSAFGFPGATRQHNTRWRVAARRARNASVSWAISDSPVVMPDTKAVILSGTPAWQEGYRAGRRGRIAGDNPYEGDTKQSRAWLMGLLDGRTKQLTLVSPPRTAATALGSPRARLPS